MKYKIYTDGACSGNPGPGGWAAIILVDDKIKNEISGSENSTTNNKMELLAPIKAIQKFKKIVIGKRNTIGIGAVVLKSTSDDEVWAGNPAKKLK